MADISQAVPAKNLSEWHTPASRSQEIQELIQGVDRYNPGNLPLLEGYLYAQVKEGTYDLLANLAILKLYQFNPTHDNPDIIVHVLIKSLAATVQGPDFNLCMSLLKEPAAILQDIDSEADSLLSVMPLLEKLHELTRTCQFTAFWKQFNDPSEGATLLRETYLPEHLHLVQSFQHLFSTTIASSFSTIPVTRLQKWLNLSSTSDAEKWCASVGWKIESGNAVIPPNGDNDVKAGVVKENVELSQLTKLVATAAY